MSDERGDEVVDRYFRLRRVLARGGMSVIHEAEHLYTGRRVVVKTLPEDRRAHPEYRGRLLREARLLERGRGQGVVEVLGAGECEHFGPYLVLEYLVGRPLDGILAARGMLTAEEALGIFAPLAATLARLHERGILHRDLKPGNIFIELTAQSRRRCKLLDFGVSTLLSAEDAATSQEKLTMRGELLGTVEYMPPEQLLARHEMVSVRSDLFSLGVSLFEALSGQLPYASDPGVRVSTLKDRIEPRRLDSLRPELKPELASLVASLLRFEPHERPASATEVAQSLLELLGAPKAAPRVSDAPAPVAPAPVARAPRPEEQRRAARAAYLTPVRVADSERALDGRAEDVSEGGLLVMLKEPVTSGATVQLRFALPMDGRMVTVSAVVRWVRHGHGRYAVGLEWVDPSPLLLASVREYVRLMQVPASA